MKAKLQVVLDCGNCDHCVGDAMRELPFCSLAQRRRETIDAKGIPDWCPLPDVPGGLSLTEVPEK